MKKQRFQSKKKRPAAPAEQAAGAPPPAAAPSGMSGRTVAIIFVLGLAIGGFVGHEVGRVGSGGGASAGPLDSYGRGPGHAHYMHTHP